MEVANRIAAVLIGRNEGQRLIASLDALAGRVGHIVYVDSGSSDGSVAEARQRGAEVISLDMSKPFTAARARNAGLASLDPERWEFVQFLDGDCAMQPDWLRPAVAAMDHNQILGAVAGRRRERHPERSVYNRLCDAEWDTPVGPALAVSGDALLRHAAIDRIGGFRDDLIAGEEPEMCVRLRAAGWSIERLPVEMSLHDADMTRFSQWWRRSRRAGYAFAEGASIHGDTPEQHWRHETRRAVLWGAVLPAIALLGCFLTPWTLLLLLAYPAQMLRLLPRLGFERAFFTVLGKFPEVFGIMDFYQLKLRKRRRTLIEYK